MEKVLVLGGSYFIGKKIVKVLLDNGYQVYTLNRGSRNPTDSRIQCLICDRDYENQMKEALQGITFDYVIDVSGLNREQSRILVEALPKETLKKFVFISSSAVYDVEHYKAPFAERTPLARNRYWRDYGQNKIEAEQYLRKVLLNGSTDLVILRPPYVYGEDNYAQRESFIFDHIVREIPILIPNDGSTYLQFIYTSDLARCIVKLLQSETQSEVILNVGNEQALTIKEWIRCCEQVAGKKAKVVSYDYISGGREIREFFPFYDYDNVLDVSRYKEIFQEETPFCMGLAEAYKWYQANKEEIRFKESVAENEAKIRKELWRGKQEVRKNEEYRY